ncbi:MAG: TonB-dependent receptor, partial [Rhizorhabdus sp.]
IDYVLGAYYLHADTDERYQRTVTTLPGPITTTGVANYGITNDNYALFGEANINFSDSFRGIAGYRSVWDDISFYHRRTSTFDPNNVGEIDPSLIRPGIRPFHDARGKLDERGDSYRLGLQLDIGERAQTYFTYSRGYKGPGYNVYFNMRSQRVPATGNTVGGVTVVPTVQPLDEVPLSPETSNSFEGGIKGSTADRSFSYALAVYSTSFKGYQANFADTVSGLQVTRLINAGSVRSRGAELDLNLRPTEGFTVDISAAYTDAKVRRFNCPVGAAVSCNIDGQPLPFAPKIKLYTNAAYRFPVSDALELEVQSDITLRSKTQYSLSQTPSTIEPAVAVWNASVAVLNDDAGWQVRAYVKNIGNEHYSSFLSNGNAAGTTRFVPRDDQRYGGLLLRKTF